MLQLFANIGLTRRTTNFGRIGAATFVCLLTACRAETPKPQTPMTSADSQRQHIAEVVAAGGVVDSILPIAVQIERFREGLPSPGDTLRSASPTRKALIDRWAKALAKSDTADLRAMVIDRAEFAWLYYPGSAMSLPPYEAPPQLLWGQIMASSNEGARGLAKRFEGKPLTVRSVTCPQKPSIEGKNFLHQRCSVSVVSGGVVVDEGRLFGTIVERDGRFKFLGYANSM